MTADLRLFTTVSFIGTLQFQVAILQTCYFLEVKLSLRNLYADAAVDYWHFITPTLLHMYSKHCIWFLFSC